MATKKKVIDKGIFNINILEFFNSGKKVRAEDSSLFVREGVLYSDRDEYDREVDEVAIGVKSNGYTMINGDDVDHGEETRDELQYGHDKEITTSFSCLKSAGLDLNSIKVIQVTKDLSSTAYPKGKNFKGFEKNIPQGATYSEGLNEKEEITYKSYHRAGSMLIESEGVRYICGMDGGNYFVSQLKTKPKNVDGAFKSLKPKRVLAYEKESGKQALRQGEWFFILVAMEASAMEEDVALPLQADGGNEHTVDLYEESKGRHYCKGDVFHEEHNTLHLGLNVLHEAIQNTASGSWSVEGVD